MNKVTIQAVNSQFEREPLIRPFGFKGGFMREIWQSASHLKSDAHAAIGLTTQNVLWSDAQVFANHSESGGNALMYAITERALRMIKGETFTSPIDLLEAILPELENYGQSITSLPQLRTNLRTTFALNSLVGVDFALWLLHAKENGYTTFDEIIPANCRDAFSHHHDKAAAIPLMAYNIPVEEIKSAVEDDGYFFMKIKIGQPGTQEEMLAKDMARIAAIHEAIGHLETPHTKDGKLPYYFDANGRYQNKETLMKLLEYTKKIGVFDQIALIEEPFEEELIFDVSDIPARLAADESAHTDKDAIERMDMGYSAIALKPIAKTLSMTLKIAQAAHERDVPCFCADLTVNPILVDWNKNVAARLKPFPGLGKLALVESNGHQNYQNWQTMLSYHPRQDGDWVQAKNGIYELGESFYDTNGGIFDSSEHYEAMFEN